MESVKKILGTGLGFGFIPVAPGTFGTLSALLLYIPLFYYLGLFGIIFGILLSVIVNYWSYSIFEKDYGVDPGCFVIDEWAGYGLSVLPISFMSIDPIIGFSIAFVLFRVFDISKILGINELQELEGAHGVLFDDLLAGLYSFIILIFLIFAVF